MEIDYTETGTLSDILSLISLWSCWCLVKRTAYSYNDQAWIPSFKAIFHAPIINRIKNWLLESKNFASFYTFCKWTIWWNLVRVVRRWICLREIIWASHAETSTSSHVTYHLYHLGYLLAAKLLAFCFIDFELEKLLEWSCALKIHNFQSSSSVSQHHVLIMFPAEQTWRLFQKPP